MPLRPLLLLLLACALAMAGTHPARADVRRCVTASGQTIFTDRKCGEVEAVEATPRSAEPAGARVERAGGCARSLQDLVFEMTSAIDARDANRLAGIYHWPGTSADAGYRIWMQLDAIANRPLVDIVPVMSPGRAAADSAESAGATPADVELYPQTTVRRNPVALRLEQTLRNSATPSRTVFGLTHYFGCWWVHL